MAGRRPGGWWEPGGSEPGGSEPGGSEPRGSEARGSEARGSEARGSWGDAAGPRRTEPAPGRSRGSPKGQQGDSGSAGHRSLEARGRIILPTPPALASGVLLELLASGELEILGRLAGSSNNALLAVARASVARASVARRRDTGIGTTGEDGNGPPTPASVGEGGLGAQQVAIPVVYKPVAGERPLWDFPDRTLAHREVAAYLLAEAAGWSIVPPTVFRDGPFGPGMVQLWVEADPAIDRVALVVGADPRLRPIALFDVVANNADRKVGHLVPTRAGSILGVDHGICFHVEPKLRTVLWAWRGERLTPEEQNRLAELRDRLHGPLADELEEHLARVEVVALRERIERLLRTPCFPDPDPDRPAIPWPPY